MRATVSIDLPVPAGLSEFKLPPAVQRRLKMLLDHQDLGKPLSVREQREAKGLVELAEFLSLLKLRARHTARRSAPISVTRTEGPTR